MPPHSRTISCFLLADWDVVETGLYEMSNIYVLSAEIVYWKLGFTYKYLLNI